MKILQIIALIAIMLAMMIVLPEGDPDTLKVKRQIFRTDCNSCHVNAFDRRG